MAGQQFWISLLKACEVVHGSMDLEKTQSTIVQTACDLFEAKGCALMLFDVASGNLETITSHGLSDQYLAKGPIAPDRSLQETILRSAVVVTNVATDSKIQYRKAAAEEGIFSIVGLPLFVGSLLVGSLRLYYGAHKDFHREELEAMQSFAVQAGLALKKNYYFDSIKETSEIHRMPAIYSFNITIERLLLAASKALHAKGCALWMLNRDKTALELVKSVGLSADYIGKGSVSFKKSIGEVVSGKPVCITCVQSDDRIQYPEEAAKEQIHGIVGLPVYAADALVGALRFYYHFEFEPDEDDFTWMTTMSAHISSAIANNKLMQKLKADSDDYKDLMEDLHADHFRLDG